MGVWEHLDEPGRLLPLLLNPANQAVAEIIERLFEDLRQTPARPDLRPVQEHLADALIDVERRYRAARYAQKSGRADPLDVLFWRRACVQLRSVGDAVAWHFLDFRRQWILFMGRNQHPGIMSDKPGFQDEWLRFTQHWDDGDPTLLNALTNCITTGDLCVARGETLVVYEVKRTPGRGRHEQTARMREVLRQINEDPRIDSPHGPTWIVESDVPLVSHWASADEAVSRAKADGAAAWVPTKGVAVLFLAWETLQAIGRDAAQALVQAQREGAAAQVGYDGHRIDLYSKDVPYRRSSGAPLTIFPISPSNAAALVTGRVLFVVEVFIDRLIDELRAAGFAPVNLLERAQPGSLPRAILNFPKGSQTITVNRGALDQLGFELTDPAAWAKAFTSSAQVPTTGTRRWNQYVCLGDEGATWR